MKIGAYYKIAKAVAEESKCASMGVGCVIVLSDEVIGSGYNGTVRGYKNCNEVWDGRSLAHSEWSQKFEIHAEMNALANCSVRPLGATAIVTTSPCFNCTKHLIAFGINRIIYFNKYDNYPCGEWEEIVEFCKDTGVEFINGEGKEETKLSQLSCQTREEFQQSHRHEGQKEGCETRGT